MIIVITGPTCSSKSKIAIEVAKALDGEIVNADAFQVYQELDIGTAKPSKEDLLKVPHHLYSYLKPTASYSICNYQRDARKCINDILKRKKPVILVGGSGLYIRAVLYDYSFKKDEHPVDLSMFDDLSNEELHKRLIEIDPKEAMKIHPNNRKRVLRALYIYYAYKTSKSDLIAMQEHKLIYKDVHIYAVLMDKSVIYERIDKRVEDMVSKGLIKEATSLVKKYGPDLQSFKAIGYREIVENLGSSTDEITKLIQKDTRNYAKRQMTFIRHQYGDDFKWVNSAKDILCDLNPPSINDRSELLLGADAIKHLDKVKIAVFGIGGVGGTAAEALVRSGVNHIHLVDHDKVNASNLNRQILFTSNDIGKYKVDAAKEHLTNVNSNAKISIYNYFLTPESLGSFPFEKMDFVIDAIDSTKSKIALIKYLLKKRIPFISSLGMGNRLDITKLNITTLDKTHDDPLAKKLREELKKEKIDTSKIKVVASTEVVKQKGEVISSMIFVPSAAGLLLASYAINTLTKKEK